VKIGRWTIELWEQSFDRYGTADGGGRRISHAGLA
jgi:hypothetical protein